MGVLNIFLIDRILGIDWKVVKGKLYCYCTQCLAVYCSIGATCLLAPLLQLQNTLRVAHLLITFNHLLHGLLKSQSPKNWFSKSLPYGSDVICIKSCTNNSSVLSCFVSFLEVSQLLKYIFIDKIWTMIVWEVAAFSAKIRALWIEMYFRISSNFV